MRTRTPEAYKGKDHVGHGQVCDVLANAPHASIVYVSDLMTAMPSYGIPSSIFVMADHRTDDWIWGRSEDKASILDPLMLRLNAATNAEAGAEFVYITGFGEQHQHFHSMLLPVPVPVPVPVAADLRAAGLLENAPRLGNQNQASRPGARIRDRIAFVSWRPDTQPVRRSDGR
jgi:hypothetical protein